MEETTGAEEVIPEEVNEYEIENFVNNPMSLENVPVMVDCHDQSSIVDAPVNVIETRDEDMLGDEEGNGEVANHELKQLKT